MKKLIALAVITWAAMMIVPVIAQVQVPFWYWPALYDASENLAVKRGVNLDGQPNDKIYLRIGWGPCLAVFQNEWDELIAATQADRYINMRSWAEQRLAEDTETIGWSADDTYNCPDAPLEVKPYWRGSRPIYYRVLDEVQNKYVRGKQSPYRISTDVPAGCMRYGTADASGELTNYWMLADDAEVYRDEIVLTAGEIAEELVTICQEQDTNVLDYRW